jgi:hypothetical protein
LPVLFSQAGLIVEGFDMEVSHSKIVGDHAFFQAEGVGIPAQLVESGFLDQQVFENMIRSWKKMLKDPNHSIMRPLFVGVARLPLDSDRVDVSTTPENSQASDGHREQSQENPDYVSASTETEEILAKLWSSAMQLPKVGVRCNFFDLGGDSLMLEQLQSDVLDQLGIQVPMAVLFQYPTVEQLAGYLDTQNKPSDSGAESKMTTVEQIANENEYESGIGAGNHAAQEINDNAALKSKAERRREALSNKKRRAERG